MKKIIKLAIAGFIGIITFTLLLNPIRVSAHEDADIPQVTEKEYLNNINGVKQIDSDQYLELVNSGDASSLILSFILVLRSAQYCRAVSRTLKQFISEAKHPIYYMNMDESSRRRQLMTINKFLESLSPFKFHGTPTFAYFHNNKIRNMLVGYPITLQQFTQTEVSVLNKQQ